MSSYIAEREDDYGDEYTWWDEYEKALEESLND